MVARSHRGARQSAALTAPARAPQPLANDLIPRQLISSQHLHRGVPHHYAAAATGEAFAFTAGACPLVHRRARRRPRRHPKANPAGTPQFVVALHEADWEQDHVVKTTIIVASSERDDPLAAWNEHESVYGNDGPLNTLLDMAALGWPEQPVEIEEIAVRR